LLENIYADLEASPFGDSMQARNGMVAVPQSAGLGVEPDMAVVAKYRQGPVADIA
jgi:L-alanine-DL-glutamate epimerase-like enolase superfamily enzyme